MTRSMSLARAAFAQPSINPRIWASSSALVSTVVISRSCFFMSMQRRRRISRPLVSGGRQVLGEAFQALAPALLHAGGCFRELRRKVQDARSQGELRLAAIFSERDRVVHFDQGLARFL